MKENILKTRKETFYYLAGFFNFPLTHAKMAPQKNNKKKKKNNKNRCSS